MLWREIVLSLKAYLKTEQIVLKYRFDEKKCFVTNKMKSFILYIMLILLQPYLKQILGEEGIFDSQIYVFLLHK